MQDKLLLWLDTDPNLADKRLEKIRNMLFDKLNSRWYLSNEDVEDLVQETLARVAQNLEKGKDVHDKVPEDYINSVANNVLKEAVDYKKKKSKRQLTFDNEQIIDQDENPEDHILTEMEQKQSSKCLKKCIRKELQPLERSLVKLYALSDGHYTKALLDQFEGSANALRIRIFRIIRKKLKPCVEKCLGID